MVIFANFRTHDIARTCTTNFTKSRIFTWYVSPSGRGATASLPLLFRKDADGDMTRGDRRINISTRISSGKSRKGLLSAWFLDVLIVRVSLLRMRYIYTHKYVVRKAFDMASGAKPE